MSAGGSWLSRRADVAYRWIIADRSRGRSASTRVDAGSPLAAAPLIVGGGVALLYGAGAVQKLGQLRSAGVPAQDVLPLVPLQQLLTLGIKQAVIAVGVAPVAFGGFWIGTRLLGSFTRRARLAADRPDDGDERGRSLVEAVELVLLVAALLALLAFVFVVVPLFLLLFLPPVGATVLLFHHRPLLASACLYAITLVVVAFGSYFYASPAPVIVLTTIDHERIRGDLLVATDQHWWVTSPDGGIRAIATARVSMAVAHSRRPPRPESASRAIASLIR